MKSLLYVTFFAASSLFVQDGVAKDCDPVAKVDGVPYEVSTGKAASMGLNRAESFTVYTVSGKSKLDQMVYSQIKEKNLEYYSVAYVVPRSYDSNYQAIVTGYYNKVE
ncbi:hypothetical protein [Photobacterium lutimaris]|uniref:Uncharacterized protein n=1 Tax=Photobacterium lutimaris TaxID=388278 RepID=A0A2T3IVC4_9GAMM|nr:hypothetical protein [Photobacterium lutimaris]PSU32373.1 hypothetical protein C9I99_17365 [Photobacterium lutimaris]TDR77569.1 hypothetical protein DFP78_102592 [Photobacterium lutimaris]